MPWYVVNSHVLVLIEADLFDAMFIHVYTVFVFFAMWILQWSTCLPLPTQDSTAFTTTSTVTRSEQTARISPHSLKKVVEKGVDLQVISFCCDRLVTPQTYAIEW